MTCSDRPGSPSLQLQSQAAECARAAESPADATLRSLEMSESYPLSDEAIDDALTRTSPGNYALGFMGDDGFHVFYVGRSDSDLRSCLHDWVGTPSRYAKHASNARAPWELRRRGSNPLDAPTAGPVASCESAYTRFAYSYAHSAEEAYAKEWRNFDAFGGSRGLDNRNVPIPADVASAAGVERA